MHNFLPWKGAAKDSGYVCKKTRSSQSPKRRNIAQSGHPVGEFYPEVKARLPTYILDGSVNENKLSTGTDVMILKYSRQNLAKLLAFIVQNTLCYFFQNWDHNIGF
jgi:hypothetical protein